MKRESWSNEKLLSRLIANRSDRTYWENVAELRKRGAESFYQQCISLTESDIAKERMIAVDVLSQLSNPAFERPFSKKVVSRFLKMLRSEKDFIVQKSILFGVGHNNQYLTSLKDIKLVASFSNSAEVCVREAVVFALLGVDDVLAIDTLIALSGDKWSSVRSWAVFGLESLIECDTPMIRAALFARVKDRHNETKNEAIVGLAVRKDERVKAIIEQELKSGFYGALLFEAIEGLEDVGFLPFLESELDVCKGDKSIDGLWLNRLKCCVNYLKSLK